MTSPRPAIDQESYQVSLEAFCGPLDLLLFLIRRAEVDVRHIPIAQITDQYLDVLRRGGEVDIDLAGEFLVMAATLIEIKSRFLAPRDAAERPVDDASEPPAESFTDPRAELIQQLLDYQRYRVAGGMMEARRLDFERRFPRRASAAGVDLPQPDLELEDASPFDLAQGYERIMSSIDMARLGDHRVEVDDTPIALYQADLLDRLQRTPGGQMTLQEAFEGHGRLVRVGMFLATLELVRLRRITVRQEGLEGPVELVLGGVKSEE